MATVFDINCTQCPRLADFLVEVKQANPDYFCKPVPAFGDPKAQLLIVGLAPGMHGANATGRPFTGDYAGVLLYETMHKFGFASKPESVAADDDLQLINCRITNAVKCLPPQNKPTTAEIKTCNAFLANELNALPDNSVVLALGSIAHGAVLRALDYQLSAYKFAHVAEHQLENFILLDSYHCSRYNTQTKRLTAEMFEAVFSKAQQLMSV
jgi:uracil-DNA glycosylase family 4